jgi:hypothetical protein
MIYKFKSKAAGDLVMTATVGEEILRLIGKESAAQGIIEVPQIVGCIARLEQAIAENDALHAQQAAATTAADDDEDESTTPRNSVSLRQRAWPFIEMLKRCLAENAHIVWGT